MTISTLLIGLFIFVARITDVSLGTLRILTIVQGRTWLSFWLGFFEITIWLTVISTLLFSIRETPVLAIFYAFGFATGNIVGIKLEKKLAFGYMVLRVFSRNTAQKLTTAIRNAGYPVTTYTGEGLKGPVVELFMICKRKNLPELLDLVTDIDSNAFYTTQPVGSINRHFEPTTPPTGWRTKFKKK